MPLNLKLDGNSDSPLYKQIVEAIQRAVHSGKLPSGYQLPTVRELADEMGISRGTIKHAYDQLQRLGIVEMTQGKGTFILGQTEEDNASRKEKAMNAIDQLFEQLEDLGFTPREMEIYVGLKLRGLEEKYDVVKVAIMDCNPETLHLIEDQLSQIGYAEVASFGLGQLNEVVEKLNSDYDLVLTTSTHYAQVEHYIHPANALGMMSLMCALIWWPNRRTTTPFHWSWAIPLISIFLSLADLAYLYSLNQSEAMISVVSMVRRSSVIISFACGALLFKEKNLKSKALDLLFILVGMLFLYLGSF